MDPQRIHIAEGEKEPYRVRLTFFEGPLDLLLYLVKKNEYDIFDIPIAEITRQYMEYLEILQVLNLDIAGEFLVMAATLAHIKSKMLLPPLESDEEEQDEDPRMELALKLIEYQRFKEAAEQLDGLDVLMRDVFVRGANVETAPEEDDLSDMTLFDLVAALRSVLEHAPKETVHEIEIEEFSIRERVIELTELITKRREVVFNDLFPTGAARSVIVITFLALLELIRERIVRVYQPETFGTIRIYSAVEV